MELDPEPAQPDAKSPHHPCHIQTLPDEEGGGGAGGGESSRSEQEEDGLDCELVAVGGREAETEEARPRAKRSSASEPDGRVPGLPPGPSSAPIPDSDGTTATGEAQKVELLLGCSGQGGPEEPGRAKERDREGGAEEEEAEEKTASSECNASVPVEAGLQDEEEENVEVVEDDDEDGGEERTLCSKQDTEVLLLRSSSPPASPCVSLSSDPGLSAFSPDTPTKQEVAYIWSLELLVASALCTSKEALYLPAPPAWTPAPPPQHGLEILAEISELGTMQRSRGGKEEIADPAAAGEYPSSSVYWSSVCTGTGRLPAHNNDWCHLTPCLGLLACTVGTVGGFVQPIVPGCSTSAVGQLRRASYKM